MQKNESTILRVLHRLEETVSKIGSARLPKYASIEDLAESYGVSQDTIRRLIHRRQIAFVQAGPNAALRIPVEDFQRWIDEHTTRPIAR